MNPNQLHTTDLSFFTRMTLEEARMHLDGKVALLDSLGFDVRFERADGGGMYFHVSHHYRHEPEKRYFSKLRPKATGADLVQEAYAAVGMYIRDHKANEPRAG